MILQPHQSANRERLREALRRYGAALDASCPGSGKTLTALHTFDEPPLVVCPAVSVGSWHRESKKAGKTLLDVLSYDKLRTGKTRYVDKRGKKRITFSWNHTGPVIFDEVHRCKAEKSQNSALLSSCPDPVLMLSATPFQSPMECRAIGQKLKLFRSTEYWTWCENHGVRNNVFGYREWNQDPVHIAKIKNALHDRMVSTTFAHVAHLYNENVVRSKILTLSAPQKAEVKRLHKELQDVLAVTEQLKIRQHLELVRLPAMIDDAKELLEAGFRPVLMLTFTESIQQAFEALPDFAVIHGGIPQSAKEWTLGMWAQNKLPGLLVNTACAGESLNLHDVIGDAPRGTLISPVFSGISRKQIHGRIHRNGGASPALQTWYWIEGTVEEKMAERATEREDLIDILTQ